MVNVGKSYKIGTVEALKVRKTGRRFYVNVPTFTVQAYGIEAGDILRVKIEKGVKPEAWESD